MDNATKIYNNDEVGELSPHFQSLVPAVEKAIEGDNDESIVNLVELARKAIISPSVDYPKPPTVLNYAVDNQSFHLLTAGSISIGIGKAKGGKTSLSILLIAAVAMGCINNPDDGFQRLESTRDGVILVFDTEQGKYYGSLTLARVKAIVGDEIIHRVQYFDLREYDPKLRLEIMNHVVEQTEKIALIVLDGVRDVAYDINDSKEAVVLTTKLMALSTQHDTHIFSILHQNKGDANARGHLGTELVNKCETVISVNKHPDDDCCSIVEAEYTRGLSFPSFSIRRDENGVPTLGTNIESMGLSKVPQKRGTVPMPSDLPVAEVFEIVSEAYQNINSDDASYKDLVTELPVALKAKKGIGMGKTRAEEWVTMLKNRGFIVNNGKSTNNAAYTQCLDLALISKNLP